MTKDEALKQAKILVTVLLTDDVISKQEAETLRQALEQPKREWVGLTDDEKWSIFTSKDWTGKPLSLIDAVLTAYEEKNHD